MRLAIFMLSMPVFVILAPFIMIYAFFHTAISEHRNKAWKKAYRYYSYDQAKADVRARIYKATDSEALRHYTLCWHVGIGDKIIKQFSLGEEGNVLTQWFYRKGIVNTTDMAFAIIEGALVDAFDVDAWGISCDNFWRTYGIESARKIDAQETGGLDSEQLGSDRTESTDEKSSST